MATFSISLVKPADVNKSSYITILVHSLVTSGDAYIDEVFTYSIDMLYQP